MRILSFGQVMNLEGGLGFIHQLTVELPTGERHVITTDEGTVQQLIAIMAGLGNEVMADSPYPVRSTGNPVGRVVPQEEYDPDLAAAPDPEAWDDEEGAMIFGGDSGDPGEVGQLVDQAPDLSPPQVGGIGFSQPQQQQLQVVNPPKILPNGKVIPPKAKTVPKDEMGYPIVPKRPVRAAAGIGQAAFSEDEDGTQI